MVLVAAPILSTYLLRPTIGTELFGVTFHPTFNGLIYAETYLIVYFQSRTEISLCYFLALMLRNRCVRIEVILLVQGRV
jgi:hypothetical protein